MPEVERLGKARVRSLNVAGYSRAGIGPVKVAKVPLAGVDAAGGALSWQNPEGGAIVVDRVTIDVTVKSTGAGTLSVGATATSGATSSANLIDTLDVGTATITTDNLQTPGTNGKQLQKVAAGKWVTGSKASGSLLGLVGTAYIQYIIL